MGNQQQELDFDAINEATASAASTQPLSCTVRIAGLLEKDYLFLISEKAISHQQAINELLPFLADDLLLEQSTIEVVTVHPDALGNKRYRRYTIRWTHQGPQMVPPYDDTPITVQFLETLLSYSVSLDDDE